jgi:hypothetical protein
VALFVRRPRTSMSILVRSKSYEVSINFAMLQMHPHTSLDISSSSKIIIIIYY